jgi:hypothetical protein
MRLPGCLLFFALLTVLTGACGMAPQNSGPCGAVIEQVPSEPGLHFAQGAELRWNSNPPATGPHYNVWAPWSQSFDRPVPRGNYVHNLEHGGVVLLYRCDSKSACPDLAAGLQQVAQMLVRDPLCLLPIQARYLISPDPLLPSDIQIAAAVWGQTYRASCLDPSSLLAFMTANYARAPEDTCADGAITWMP